MDTFCGCVGASVKILLRPFVAGIDRPPRSAYDCGLRRDQT